MAAPEHLGVQLTPIPEFRYPFSTIGYDRGRFAEALQKQPLEDQVFFVWGASPSGIGGTAALMAAEAGARVITSSRPGKNSDRSEAFAERLTEAGKGRSLWLPGDITDPKSRKAVIDELLLKTDGKLDGVIITTGMRGSEGPITFLGDDPYHDALQVNALSPMAVVRDLMRRRKRKEPERPLRVTLTSTVASEGSPLQGPYAASKAALETLAKIAAREAVLFKTDNRWGDIMVNVVSPGATTTDFLEGLTQEAIDFLVMESGADRASEPFEVASLILYLTTQFAEGRSGFVVPIIGEGPVPTR